MAITQENKTLEYLRFKEGVTFMKIIKELSQDIECALDHAEDCAKKAILYKSDYPTVAQRYYNTVDTYFEIIKNFHDEVTKLIADYRKTEGEPPAPMMAIYNYFHERYINKMAAVKTLQELFKQ